MLEYLTPHEAAEQPERLGTDLAGGVAAAENLDEMREIRTEVTP